MTDHHPSAARAQLLMEDIGVSGDRTLDRILSDFDAVRDSALKVPSIPFIPDMLLNGHTLKGTDRMRKFTITDPSGSPYLTRYVIEEFPDGSAIFLHLIHRSDNDREFHDHPWDFRSFIVRGGYAEHTPESRREFYPGQWNVRKAEYLHRLELFDPGEDTVTILFRGPKRREWGFQAAEPGSPWIHNEKYLDAKFGKGNYTKEP